MDIQIQLKNLIRLIEGLQVLAFFFAGLGIVSAFRGDSLADVLVPMILGAGGWVARYPLIKIFEKAFDQMVRDEVALAKKQEAQ